MRPTVKIVLMGKVLQDGRQSISLRLTFQRKCRYFALNLKCLSKEWDEISCRFRKNYPTWREDNDYLISVEKRASDIIREFAMNNSMFTMARFGQEMFSTYTKGSHRLVSDCVNAMAEYHRNKGSYNTSVNFKAHAMVVSAFRPKSVMADIDEKWLSDFEKYQRNVRGSSGSGILTNMCVLRTVCRWMIKNGEMPDSWYPFKKYQMGHLKGSGVKRALTLDDIRKIEQAEVFGKIERLARDMFIFSFYCRGINLADIMNLTVSNVKDGRLLYSRQKTGRKYSILLPDKTLQMISAYNGKTFLFPLFIDGEYETPARKLTRRKYFTEVFNYALRDIAVRVGVDTDNLTFYSARHTYATALLKKGVNVAVISEAMGHSDIRTTQVYLKSFGDDVIDKADELLL